MRQILRLLLPTLLVAVTTASAAPDAERRCLVDSGGAAAMCQGVHQCRARVP